MFKTILQNYFQFVCLCFDFWIKWAKCLQKFIKTQTKKSTFLFVVNELRFNSIIIVIIILMKLNAVVISLISDNNNYFYYLSCFTPFLSVFVVSYKQCMYAMNVFDLNRLSHLHCDEWDFTALISKTKTEYFRILIGRWDVW